MIKGSFLFKLKDTHGLPLEIAIDEVLSNGLKIEWASFIEEARSCGWYDFMTFDVINYAIAESIEATKKYKDELLSLVMAYMLKYRQVL